MIKDEKQRTTRMGNREDHLTKDVPITRSAPIKRRFFYIASKPARQSISQQVLAIADRMIEEYKTDLDYLKDR